MSNASMLERLSCNIFITNFPAYFSSKDLWNTFSKFGTVLDVYIPNKVSKQRKRYAFSSFKKVSNVDSLISSLRSVWLGSFHLYDNVARFNRGTKTSNSQKSHSNVPLNTSKPSYAKVLGKKEPPQNHDEPVIVLEEGMLNFEGKVYVVRAKEVTGWVSDFGEENSDKSKDYSDNNSVGKKNWVEYEEISFVNQQKKSNKVAHEMNDSNPKFPPGFTPQHLDHYEYEKVEALHESTTPQDSKKGNMLFYFATSSARGRSGGTWMANNVDLLFISVYSPQESSLKRVIWNYMLETLNRWHGEVIIMGDLNERLKEWSSIKRRNKDHDKKVIQDSHIEIDLRLDKGNGLPDRIGLNRRLNRTRPYHFGQVLGPVF
nr:peptide chain release factor APG3, chloroplastic [Tanacetum cinerariifolium]